MNKLKTVCGLLVPVLITLVLGFFALGSTVAMIYTGEIIPVYIPLNILMAIVIWMIWHSYIQLKKSTGSK